MNQLRRVLAFGLPFLRPYRTRFLAAVGLALVFGASNGVFVLATKTLFERLSPSPVVVGQVDPQSLATRFSTLANMDEIVVLDAGRIAERGTFSALIAKKGLFAGMAAQQGIS